MLHFKRTGLALTLALFVFAFFSGCDYVPKGDLQIFLIGADSEGNLDEAKLTISKVEAFLEPNLEKNASAKPKWITLSNKTVAFDLVALEENSYWQARVPAGHYSKVDIEISSASIVRNGQAEQVYGASKLSFPASFDVSRGQMSNITIALNVKKLAEPGE